MFVTYHPAALLYAKEAKAGDKGLSKESILRALTEDLQRVHKVLSTLSTGTTVSTTLPEPIRVPGTDTVPTALGTVLGLDTEYVPSSKYLLTCSFSNGDTVLDWDRDLTPNVNPTQPDVEVLVGHNLPEDIALAWEAGYIPKRVEFLDGSKLIDTLLLARMVYEGQASYKLEDLLASLYTVNPWKHKTSAKDVTTWTPEERVERCGLDAWAPLQLVKKHWPQLSSEAQQQLYPFTTAIMMTLHRLTLAGAFVDPKDFGALVQQKSNERMMLNAKLVQAASLVGVDEFEPTNDDQIRRLLYDKLELPVIARTKTKQLPAVTKETLATLTEYAPEGTRAFLELLIQFNKTDKVLTTYLEGSSDPEKESRNAIKKLAHQVRMHSQEFLWLPFHFNVLGAKTARRSSSNPNSQNWPKSIRRLVRSRWPGGFILAADYRKLEPVIIAWLAQDERLLEYFTTGNGYIGIAEDLFRTKVEEGTELYRGVKSIVLGVHYDMGSDEMARQMWFEKKIRLRADYDSHWEEIDRLRNLYLSTYPNVRAYMERRRAEARARGGVTTPTGRIRTVGNRFVDKHILNQAINAPVQSTASDVTGAALVDCERAILQEAGLSLIDWYDHLITQRRKYLTQEGTYGIIPEQWRIPTLFNEVHDEITSDLPPEWEKKGVELIVETMRSVPTLRRLAPFLKDMPLYVDPKLGSRWGEG